MEEEVKTNLTYEPAPSKPDGFDADLLKICGLAPNGDSYLRFVWGMDRTEQWGDDKVIRYPDVANNNKGLPRWILEGWQSSSVYDEAEWNANKDIMGEFPRRGVYDFIEILRTPDNKFIPLGVEALEMARSWRFWKSKGNKRAVADLLEQRANNAMYQEAKYAQNKEKILADFREDFANAYQDKDNNIEFSLPKERRTEAGIILP